MPSEQEIDRQIQETMPRLTDFEFKIDSILAEFGKMSWKAVALEGIKKTIGAGLDKIPVPGVSGALSAGWYALTAKDPPGTPIAKAAAFLLVVEAYAGKVREVTNWQGALPEATWKVQCNQVARAIVAKRMLLEQLAAAKEQIMNIELTANYIFNAETERLLRAAIYDSANPAIEMTTFTANSAAPNRMPPNLPTSQPPAFRPARLGQFPKK